MLKEGFKQTISTQVEVPIDKDPAWVGKPIAIAKFPSNYASEVRPLLDSVSRLGADSTSWIGTGVYYATENKPEARVNRNKLSTKKVTAPDYK